MVSVGHVFSNQHSADGRNNDEHLESATSAHFADILDHAQPDTVRRVVSLTADDGGVRTASSNYPKPGERLRTTVACCRLNVLRHGAGARVLVCHGVRDAAGDELVLASSTSCAVMSGLITLWFWGLNSFCCSRRFLLFKRLAVGREGRAAEDDDIPAAHFLNLESSFIPRLYLSMSAPEMATRCGG